MAISASKVTINLANSNGTLEIKSELQNNDIFEEQELNNIYNHNIKYIPCQISTININDEDASEIPIQLIENQNYYFSIKSDESDIILNNIQNSNTYKVILKQGNEIIGEILSNNNIGLLNLENIGIEEKIIEIISTKIDYKSDYKFMLNDINDFCIEIINKIDSLFGKYRTFSQIIDPNIYSSKIAYLKEILNKSKLPSWIHYLETNYNTKLHEVKEEQYIYDCDNVEIDELIDALNGENIIKNLNLPLIINHSSYESIKNTSENKFVKFFMNSILSSLDNISQYYQSSEITNIINTLNDLLKSDFFRDIDNLDRIPYNSQILQKKYPYNNIYQVYNNLQLLSNINLDIDIFKYYVGQSNMPTLYEYWCFIKIFNLLFKKYKCIDYKNLITENNGIISVKIGKNNTIKASFEIDNSILNLYYNKTYSKATESYSHELAPDISLELENINEKYSLHFDAKYRVSADNSFASEDIDKMHTYKDAILSSKGAFILGLGKDNQFFSKPNEAFPSVGGISFIPGKSNDKCIYNLIEDFVKKYKEEI